MPCSGTARERLIKRRLLACPERPCSLWAVRCELSGRESDGEERNKQKDRQALHSVKRSLLSRLRQGENASSASVVCCGDVCDRVFQRRWHALPTRGREKPKIGEADSLPFVCFLWVRGRALHGSQHLRLVRKQRDLSRRCRGRLVLWWLDSATALIRFHLPERRKCDVVEL